ncbi:MAG: crossover junction endodeoxyribonuclease RuvC [Candidatus Paceibacterota bacterium]|jgi:crossover junction endodeoxyribonuclease RuvC
MANVRVLGIDPGYGRLGVAIVEKTDGKEKLIFSTCIESSSKEAFVDRLLYLGQEIEKIIKKFKPEVLAIEKLFFTTNQKTAMNVSEVKGMITFISRKNGLKILELTPLEIKNSMVGYGKADKNQISFMVKKILNLENKKAIDDEFDAIAVGLTGLVLSRHLL